MGKVPGTIEYRAEDLPCMFQIATSHHAPVYVHARRAPGAHAVTLRLCYGHTVTVPLDARVFVLGEDL